MPCPSTATPTGETNWPGAYPWPPHAARGAPDGESFWIGAQARDHKVAHILRSGLAGVEVDGDVCRKRGIYSTGAARIIDGADGKREYIRITAEQVPRYQPGRPPRETAARYGKAGEPVVICVTPDRMISWGR